MRRVSRLEQIMRRKFEKRIEEMVRKNTSFEARWRCATMHVDVESSTKAGLLRPAFLASNFREERASLTKILGWGRDDNHGTLQEQTKRIKDLRRTSSHLISLKTISE